MTRFAYRNPLGVTAPHCERPIAAKLADNKTKEHWFVHCYTNELTDNKTLFCHFERSEKSQKQSMKSLILSLLAL